MQATILKELRDYKAYGFSDGNLIPLYKNATIYLKFQTRYYKKGYILVDLYNVNPAENLKTDDKISTASLEPEVSAEPTATPTPSETPSVTAEPTETPVPEVTAEPTIEPTPETEVTVEPTETPEPTETADPDVSAEPADETGETDSTITED